jgi:hypothetical protein
MIGFEPCLICGGAYVSKERDNIIECVKSPSGPPTTTQSKHREIAKEE